MKIAKMLAAAGSETDRLLTFLDAQPNDDVFSTAEIQETLQCAFNSGCFKAQRSRWKHYETKIILNGRVASVWGNKIAIAQLKKGIAHED
jgi:hypothetical protein